MAVMGSVFLLELGELANFTVMGSAAPSGIVPLSCLMARSASCRWSNRMKPTPLDSPEVATNMLLIDGMGTSLDNIFYNRHTSYNFQYFTGLIIRSFYDSSLDINNFTAKIYITY